MSRNASVIILFILFVSLACVVDARPSRLLQPSLKHDFTPVEYNLLDDPGMENWLCPYSYSPVPLDLKSPIMRRVLSNLTQLFNEQFNFSKYAASAVLTYRGQEIWEWGSGKDPSTGRTTTADSIFRIGSVTKVFSGLLLLVAESKGLLNVDDAVRKQIPELQMIDPFHAPSSPRQTSFTWGQVASHTAGLPREAPCAFHSCQRSTSEMLNRLKQVRLILPAAAQPSYSNLGYGLLGNLLAQVMKDDFSSLVQNHLLGPLGMKNSSFTIPNRYVPPVPNMPLVDLGWLAPSGQMFSTARDLSRLAIALNSASADQYRFGNPRWPSDFHSHQAQKESRKSSIKSNAFGHDSMKNASKPLAINQNSLRELMFPTYVNPDGTGYGMPWEFARVGPYYIRNKGGNLQGYSANIALVPELQLGLTITSNLGLDASIWATQSLAQFIPEFESVLDPLQSMPKITNHPEKYIGSYNPATEISINFAGQLSITKLKGLTTDLVIVPSAAEPNNFGVMQIYVPQALLPCMTFEFTAFSYQYVEFKFDENGKSTSFSIPGLMFSDQFTRKT